MTRDEAILLMSPRLYELLGMMLSRWANWMPQVGFPRVSAGMVSGGRVTIDTWEDLESEVDTAAVLAIEAAWGDLSQAERVMIEQCMGRLPWVFTARPGTLEAAIEKLERKIRV